MLGVEASQVEVEKTQSPREASCVPAASHPRLILTANLPRVHWLQTVE